MTGDDKVIHISDELLALGIGELDLSPRVISRLQTVGIRTVMELMYCCSRKQSCEKCPRETCTAEHKLVDIPQFGKVSIDEIFIALKKAADSIMEEKYNALGKGRHT